MIGPRIHLATIGFALLWFTVVAPGHQRGVLTLPGTEGPTAACCPLSAASGSNANAPDSDGERPTAPCHDPAQSCAICQLNTTLSMPTHIELAHPPLALLGWHRAEVAARQPFARPLRTFNARPPPSVLI